MFKYLAFALSFAASVALADPRLVFSGKVSIGGEGGLSGLELGTDGTTGMVLSDRGNLFDLTLSRVDGKLSGAQLKKWPKRSKLVGDVEGVATSDGQTYFVSFEGPAKIVSLSADGILNSLPRHPHFREMGLNRALEAVAIDEDGVIYTLPEAPAPGDDAFPLYMFQNGQWQIGPIIRRRGTFLAVGADFGPDNLFYLLERSITPLGFRTRVRRFDLSKDNLGEQTLLTTWPSQRDNLEGLSIWMDDENQIRATMVSDDNFLAIQRSEIVEYILTE